MVVVVRVVGTELDVCDVYLCNVYSEDRDGSGFISWEEFSGPKGAAPPDYSAPEFQVPVRHFI